MTKLPVWFVSHGAPDIVLQDNATTQAWAALAESLDSMPDIVLCISAHWDRGAPALAGVESAIQHDFGGFAPDLYERRWSLVDASEAVHWLGSQLGRRGVDVALVPRPLDHGVWVPLSRMWPQPSVPVVQLSLSSPLGAPWHLTLGRHLAPLRERGVLIIASGGVVHNLRRLSWSGANADDEAPDSPPQWAVKFVEAVETALASGDEAALCSPWSMPGGRESVPTLEHYLPLLVAYGAASPDVLIPVHRAWSHGSLGLHAYAA